MQAETERSSASCQRLYYECTSVGEGEGGKEGRREGPGSEGKEGRREGGREGRREVQGVRGFKRYAYLIVALTHVS